MTHVWCFGFTKFILVIIVHWKEIYCRSQLDQERSDVFYEGNRNVPISVIFLKWSYFKMFFLLVSSPLWCVSLDGIKPELIICQFLQWEMVHHAKYSIVILGRMRFMIIAINLPKTGYTMLHPFRIPQYCEKSRTRYSQSQYGHPLFLYHINASWKVLKQCSTLLVVWILGPSFIHFWFLHWGFFSFSAQIALIKDLLWVQECFLFF